MGQLIGSQLYLYLESYNNLSQILGGSMHTILIGIKMKSFVNFHRSELCKLQYCLLVLLACYLLLYSSRTNYTPLLWHLSIV